MISYKYSAFSSGKNTGAFTSKIQNAGDRLYVADKHLNEHLYV